MLFIAFQAVKLLILYHVDPFDFDTKCDGSLPLEKMLSPDPRMRKLLKDIDRSKCRVWALTNAYRTVRPILLFAQVNAVGLTGYLVACRTRLEHPEATGPNRRHRIL